MSGEPSQTRSKEKWKGHKKRRTLKDLFRQAKDGIITGAADNDPAGVVTYTQVGASTQYSLIWLALLCIPLIYAVEEMGARISVVTKHGLNAMIAKRYGLKLAVCVALIVAFANVATIAADIGGMAAVLGMLAHMPYQWFIVPVGAILTYILYKGNYAAVSRFLLILTPFFLVYVAAAFFARPDMGEVVREAWTFSGQNEYILMAIALLGTTIAPYLLFWQSTEEVEEHKTVSDLKEESRGVLAGMIYMQLNAIAVMIAAGVVLYGAGMIATPDQAALALKPAAGPLAFILFSFGIIISGLLAIPVLAASTAYVVADAFHWHEGLDRSYKEARPFYHILLLAILIGLIISFFTINPIRMLIYTQVLNGFLMPFLIWVTLRMADDREVVGNYRSTPLVRFFGWCALITFLVFDGLMIWQWMK